MTTKERKQIKHSLKTNIDSADTWIKMALAGADLGGNEDTSDPLTKGFLVQKLKTLRHQIANDANAFLAEVDKAIEKLS